MNIFMQERCLLAVLCVGIASLFFSNPCQALVTKDESAERKRTAIKEACEISKISEGSPGYSDWHQRGYYGRFEVRAVYDLKARKCNYEVKYRHVPFWAPYGWKKDN